MNNFSSWIEDAKQSINIVQVAKKLGLDVTNNSSKCPFHSDTNPSLHFYKLNFHCFGCDAHGDIFTLVEKLKNVSFYEACLWLADKFNLSNPPSTYKKIDAKARLERSQLDMSLTAFFSCCYDYLTRDKDIPNKAKAYLTGRGFTTEDCKRFGIGVVPPLPYLKKALISSGIPLSFAIKHNLFPQPEDDYHPLRFLSGSIVGTWRNRLNKIVTFWFRSVEPNPTHKYTYLKGYKKTCLFGEDASINNKDVVLVEGVFDVLTLKKHFERDDYIVLGTGGSQPSSQQLKSLLTAKSITLALDNDSAGAAATLSLVEKLQNSGFSNLYVMRFAEAKDADELIRKFGVDKFINYLNEAESAYVYKANEIIKQIGGGKREVLDAAMKILYQRGLKSSPYLFAVVSLLKSKLNLTQQEISKIQEKPKQLNKEVNQKRPEFQLLLTDLGNAERFVLRNSESFFYTSETGWLAWDETRWNRHNGEHLAQEAAKQVTRELIAYAETLLDEEMKKEYLKHALKSQAAKRIKAILDLARSDKDILSSIDEFDQNDYLLNLQNGTYDLLKHEFLCHKRTDKITKLTPVSYNPRAECPVWKETLEGVFIKDDGSPDYDIIQFMQRALGYTLSGLTKEHVIFICWGSGRNGKTTILKTIANVLGEYSSEPQIETFINRNQNSNTRNDLAALTGVRLALTSEPDRGARLAEGLIKRLTGGEGLAVRFLYSEFFTLNPKFKIWLLTNVKPIIKGVDDGIWNRIILIPFTRYFEERERDPDLMNKLRNEYSGILNWLIAGWKAYQLDGLLVPDKLRLERAKYRSESNNVVRFLEESCIVGIGGEVTRKLLFSTYEDWCKENDEEPLSKQSFARILRHIKQIGERKTMGLMRWTNNTFNTSEEIEAEEPSQVEVPF